MEKNKKDINAIISEMTLEEKAGMCSGYDYWHTKGIERLGIPSIMMSDGPHGLRKQGDEVDHLGIKNSIPATCFPTGSALACSWDRDLLEKLGVALGEECQAEGISILLGPGTNLKRSPLCGRNFEYFSEDPYQASEMVAGYIKGIQSQGVGASLKHFAANNQEQNRFITDTIVDERTLREMYLAVFEGAVKKSQPWTVMCAYNKLNGTYCSEHKTLLNDILKEEWGHEGIVISDWGAVNERVEGLSAGLELEMPPGCFEGDKKIIEAVKNGTLSEKVLDEAVKRLLRVIIKAEEGKKTNACCDLEAHHRLAREVAKECMVLLKNQDNILPLKKSGTLAVIGGFAQKARFQGGGSSHVNAAMVDNALIAMEQVSGPELKIIFAEGYPMDVSDGRYCKNPFQSVSDKPDEQRIKEARDIAAKADVAVVFVGLPESYESEGSDRKHLRIPEGHIKLIEAVAEVQENVVVVLSNGSPIEMPWLAKVKGVLEGYLGGQAFGGAVADLLFGEANPCGKLAETFPRKLSDTPAYLNLSWDGKKVEYGEGLFIGYRYYDAKEIEPLFPFGFGLSYTNFEYTAISLDKKELLDNETLTVNVSIKNVGKTAGKEIVQLYVHDLLCSVIRPQKELKGFEKVALLPGEEKTVTINLDKRAFAFYNTDIMDWYVESGDFEILVGKSSREILLTETVSVKSGNMKNMKLTRNSTFTECTIGSERADIMRPLIEALMTRFALEEGSTRAKEFLDSMPIRVLISFQSLPFTEKDMDTLLGKLNDAN